MFRITCVLLLLITMVMIQSCSAPKQVAKPDAPVPVTAVKPAEPPAPVSDPNEFIVFYDSDPPGAVLYELGKNDKVGETPFWASYRLTDKDRKEGEVSVDPSRVVWPSGATASNHPGLVFILNKGLEQTYVFVRPDVPGRDADYAAGLNRVMYRYANGEDDSGPKTGK